MTRTRRQIVLAFTAAVTLTFLTVFLMNPAIARDAVRPREIEPLARWIAEHPADWLGASLFSSQALDSNNPRRRELWRAAYAHASRLAPRRQNPGAAFVRGGLFHWYELGEADRKEVLRITAPMLRDPKFFAQMHRPLWELTRDLAYIRRNAPDTEIALVTLRDLAAANGFFADYRDLRAELARNRMRTFEAGKGTLTAVELIRLVPVPIMRDDDPLVRGVLAALQRHPLDASSAVSVNERGIDLAEFAIRHGLGPLEGLEVLVETREVHAARRARLARALGREDEARRIAAPEPVQTRQRQWSGTCGPSEVCSAATATINTTGEITLDVAVVQTDEIPPYVEIYVDDERLAEGTVDDARRFTVPVRAAGEHRVEVRLANPLTRNRIQRRVRLS